MLWVHVPFYQHQNGLNEIRNEICEKNGYVYEDYFFEHRGQSLYYILKVKINDVSSYVSYNNQLELVDTYQGSVADIDSVKSDILKKYKKEVSKQDVKTLDIGYENGKFVYYVKVQNKNKLLYLYYNLNDGSFMKAIRIESDL